MENLHFTDESIAGLLTQSVLMMILPFVLLIIWKMKTHEKILPVIVGAATWLLFAIILKLAPAYLLLNADNPVAKTISGNLWLTAVLSGVLAGLFEETGRFLAFRTVLKKYEYRRSSISYGIGHGGFESIYIGFQFLMFPLFGIMLNSGMSDQLTTGMDEATKVLMAEQLAPYSDLSFAECLLGVFERIPAIVMHISFSVLVFAAARDNKYTYLFLLSMLLHALVDFFAVVAGGINLNIWATELIIAAFAAALAYFASRVYKNLNGVASQAASVRG
ncbi:MAG: YhfC family intramembrane metalloprotease [Ruminiclostridium sp.]|nr:YhfC family intramembrane metalloprotease [Ruminiclostridium sp.]